MRGAAASKARIVHACNNAESRHAAPVTVYFQ